MHKFKFQEVTSLEIVIYYAPVTSLSFKPYSSACNPSRAFFPSSVRSGFPLAVTAFVKNLGFHSSFFSFLWVALSRCRSSISCLSLVASVYCLLFIALVTLAEKRWDSFGSCWSIGGMILAVGNRGLRSNRTEESWHKDR